MKTMLPLLLVSMALTFSGCLNVKPVVDPSRFFVLTPPSGTTLGATASHEGWAVGIGRVDIPDYLLSKRIVLRKGNNEMDYSETLHWAERLDKGIQRVLGAAISSQLGSTNVVLSAWRRSDVQAEVYVSVQRFESDEQGRLVLEARWRITNPGAEITWRNGVTTVTGQGPSFVADPDGAAAALSGTLADLSREITAALRQSASPRSPR